MPKAKLNDTHIYYEAYGAGAELIMFPGAHHAFNVEFADRCNQAVIDFLS